MANRASSQAAAQREALLSLSRTLAGPRLGGVLSEALEIVLRGASCARGAVFEVDGDHLALVAHEGLPPRLRVPIERLPLRDAWFIVQRAAKLKQPVVEAVVVTGGRLDRRALEESGWLAAAAVPLVGNRAVHGVLLVGAADEEMFTPEVLAFLETAGNVVGLWMSHDAEATLQDRGVDIKTAQMAAIGLVATAFANDLRGPLMALRLQIKEQERLLASLCDGDDERAGELAPLVEIANEASLTIDRARDITARLLAMVRDTPPEQVDLAAVATDAVSLVTSSFDRQGIEVRVAVDEDCEVIGRRDELLQLFTSLLVNAADACAVSLRLADEAGCVELTVRREGARVVASVSDSGPGVPPDLRARIFEPFFTTKESSAGLGLTLAKQTVMAHRGHIELASSPLGGALFRVVLPSATPGAGTERARPSSFPPPPQATTGMGTRLRVLWIDDDEVFLRGIRRALTDIDIAIASSADEADAMLRNPKNAFAAVFCDIGLPDRSGDALHAAIAERDPALASRFVFVTGGVVTPEAADYLIASGCPTLLKPVRVEDVIALLGGEGDGETSPWSSVPTLREGWTDSPPPPLPPSDRPPPGARFDPRRESDTPPRPRSAMRADERAAMVRAIPGPRPGRERSMTDGAGQPSPRRRSNAPEPTPPPDRRAGTLPGSFGIPAPEADRRAARTVPHGPHARPRRKDGL